MNSNWSTSTPHIADTGGGTGWATFSNQPTTVWGRPAQPTQPAFNPFSVSKMLTILVTELSRIYV